VEDEGITGLETYTEDELERRTGYGHLGKSIGVAPWNEKHGRINDRADLTQLFLTFTGKGKMSKDFWCRHFGFCIPRYDEAGIETDEYKNSFVGIRNGNIRNKEKSDYVITRMWIAHEHIAMDGRKYSPHNHLMVELSRKFEFKTLSPFKIPGMTVYVRRVKDIESLKGYMMKEDKNIEMKEDEPEEKDSEKRMKIPFPVKLDEPWMREIWRVYIAETFNYESIYCFVKNDQAMRMFTETFMDNFDGIIGEYLPRFSKIGSIYRASAAEGDMASNADKKAVKFLVIEITDWNDMTVEDWKMLEGIWKGRIKQTRDSHQIKLVKPRIMIVGPSVPRRDMIGGGVLDPSLFLFGVREGKKMNWNYAANAAEAVIGPYDHERRWQYENGILTMRENHEDFNKRD
jgi:hypothetical protein